MTTRIKSKTQKKSKPAASRFRMPAEKPWPSRIEEANEGSSADLESSLPAATEPASPASESSDSKTAGEAPSHPVVTKPEFCLLVMPDGDWPVLEIFPDVESLTKRMRELEGGYLTVFPFFGIPVPFTRGPDRFLQLPNGLPHPMFDCSCYGTFVGNPMRKLPIDTAYFLGPDDERGVCPDPAVIDHRPVTPQAKTGTQEQPKEKAVPSSRDKRRKVSPRGATVTSR